MSLLALLLQSLLLPLLCPALFVLCGLARLVSSILQMWKR